MRFAVESGSFFHQNTRGMDVAVQGGGTFQHRAAGHVDVALHGAEDQDGLRLNARLDVVFTRNDDRGRAVDFSFDAAGNCALVRKLERADDGDIGGDLSGGLGRRRAGQRRR